MRRCRQCRYAGKAENRGEIVCEFETLNPRTLDAEKRACRRYKISAYAFLRSIADAESRIKRMSEQTVRFREIAERATGTTEATRTSGTVMHSKIADNIDKCVDGERKIQSEIDKLRQRYALAVSLIAKVSTPAMRTVIELRHIKRLEWDQIARQMGYDNSQVRRINKRAMQELQSEMEEAGIVD